MKKFTLFALSLSLFAFAEESAVSNSSIAQSAPVDTQTAQVSVEGTRTVTMPDVAKISEAFGHLIGRNLESLGFKLDIAQVIKGLQDASAGIASPMTEIEWVQAMTAAQETAFKHLSAANLEKATAFLSNNQQKEGVVSLEEGKIQYKIDEQGSGAIVEEHFSPLIRYTGKFLDGTVFSASKEDMLVSLDETIQGFSKGLLGMKEGEKRTLFIHPDLGYGTSGDFPPNALLTFEIEVVKANAPQTEPLDSLTTSHPKVSPEVAMPQEEPKVVR